MTAAGRAALVAAARRAALVAAACRAGLIAAARRAAFIAAAGLLLASPAVAQSPRLATLTVIDHLSSGQLEETITVYLEGVPAGTLHVDPLHPDDSFQARVPGLPSVSFALCGKLMRRDPDGAVTPHPIDNGGAISGYDGGKFAAITLGDVLFTLEDETGHATTTVKPGPSCNAAVS